MPPRHDDDSKTRSFPAKPGQLGIRMACGCKGGVTTIVHAAFADDWRCERCHRPGRPTGHLIKLGPGGALPPRSAWGEPLCPHLAERCAVCTNPAAA